MSQKSGIEWTDATWPIVAGCEYVSPECTRCYAVRDSWRMAHNPNPKVHTPFFGTVDKTEKGELVWSGIIRTLPVRLAWPLQWRAPRRIFVCNLADLFHPKVPFEFIAAAFGVMARARQHTFQVLTKHPARMRQFFSWVLSDDTCVARCWAYAVSMGFMGRDARQWDCERAWPLANVHLGVTAGDQKRAEERIPELLGCPAEKRFLSYEPALGPVDLGRYLSGTGNLDWVIAGGESGPRARPAHPDWFRKVRDDCAKAGVPFHFKQWGTWAPCDTGVDMDAPRPRRAVYPIEEAVELAPERGYQVISRHEHEFVKAGKKLAGRTLDGVTHDGVPA